MRDVMFLVASVIIVNGFDSIPALYLFRVTGFSGNHRPFEILFSLSGLKEET